MYEAKQKNCILKKNKLEVSGRVQREAAQRRKWKVNLGCRTARRLKKIREDTPTSPEVIDSHMLNFRPYFKFSRLKLFGRGTPPPWCVR